MNYETGALQAPFDFDELAGLLLEQGSAVSPSEVHGCLSGLLSGGIAAEPERGLDALGRALDLAAHGELAERIMQLYGATALALADEEFSFHPLLPDDEVDIETRTAALAGWSRGFTAGFTQALPGNDGAAGLSEDCREILGDIAAMAQAAVGDEESEEESEGSYAEIVEYLRFAVLNVFMEGAAREGQSGPAPGAPLH